MDHILSPSYLSSLSNDQLLVELSNLIGFLIAELGEKEARGMFFAFLYFLLLIYLLFTLCNFFFIVVFLFFFPDRLIQTWPSFEDRRLLFAAWSLWKHGPISNSAQQDG